MRDLLLLRSPTGTSTQAFSFSLGLLKRESGHPLRSPGFRTERPAFGVLHDAHTPPAPCPAAGSPALTYLLGSREGGGDRPLQRARGRRGAGEVLETGAFGEWILGTGERGEEEDRAGPGAKEWASRVIEGRGAEPSRTVVLQAPEVESERATQARRPPSLGAPTVDGPPSLDGRAPMKATCVPDFRPSSHVGTAPTTGTPPRSFPLLGLP